MTRRHFLRGLGVVLPLPALLQHASARPAQHTAKRMLLISNNLGVIPGPFFPKQTGFNYTLSPLLKNLEAFRNEFTIFSGLSHPAVSGGHSTENCFLTGAKDPTGSGFRNTVSLDQYAIEHLGQRTRFPTLNLGVNIDRGNRSLSWSRDGALLPAEDKPSALFRKMFIQGSPREIERRLHSLKERGSILDTLRADAKRLQTRSGHEDKFRLDQYFTSIRELEKGLIVAEEWETRPKPTINHPEPKDILDRARFFPKLDLMLRMARLAFESDSTRIVTLMVDAFATPVFEISDKEKSLTGYHDLSHHGQSPEKIRQLEKTDHRQMQTLAALFKQLRETREHNNSLLDTTMVLYGSNMGDANVHNCDNLPILLAGGRFKHGQHLSFDARNNQPLCRLFISMLQQMGIESDTFSSGHGTLPGLKIS
tara:strand:+ start:1051 stop:2319 length:1269 start_codon:yes stop_codon:yes gene_type:complete